MIKYAESNHIIDKLGEEMQKFHTLLLEKVA